MDAPLCSRGLAEALDVSGLRLGLGVLLAMAGIFGFGILSEWLSHRRTADLRPPSMAHAFASGAAIVSLLMLLASLVGLCQPAAVIALLGVGLGTCLIASRRLRFAAPRPWFWLILLFTVPALAHVVLFPTRFSDATSIWVFHGKALTCACLFDAPYVKEAVWTGTHPEYPLFLAFLDAYFFTLTDSFRDDLAKLWMAGALLCAVWVVFGHFASRGKYLAGCAAAIAVLAAVRHAGSEDQVELVAVVFAALITIGVLQGDTRRLPLYLFALAWNKNEGLAMVLALIVLLLVFTRRWPRYLWVYVPLLGLGVLVQSRLPSRHEQYPSRLLSLTAWREGSAAISTIVNESAKIFFDYFWWPPFVAALIAGLVLWRWRRERPTWFALLAWPWAMLGFFMAIYIVSPWGAHLNQITFARLLTQLFAPAMLIVLTVLAEHPRLWTSALVAVVGVHYFGDAFGVNRLTGDLARVSRGDVGLSAYRSHWPEAFSLDASLPKATNGAFLRADDPSFSINYALFPRRIYPGPPELVSGTSRPAKKWSTLEEVAASGIDYEYVLEGWRLVWPPAPR